MDSPLRWYDIVDKEQRKIELRNPQRVAEWLGALQTEALAGLVQYPDLIHLATGHLFASPNPLMLPLFNAVKGGARSVPEMYAVVERRLAGVDAYDFMSLVNLQNFWCSRPSTRVALDRLKRFISWQYRRELAARKAAA